MPFPIAQSLFEAVAAVATLLAVVVALWLGLADRVSAREALGRERVTGAAAIIQVSGELYFDPAEPPSYQGLASVHFVNSSRYAVYSAHVHYEHYGVDKVARFDAPLLPGGSTDLALPDREPDAVQQLRPVELVFRSSDDKWWRRDPDGGLTALRRDCHPAAP